MRPVTTIDGRVVDSSGEEWRRCCEAVWTLGKPEADRAAWMAGIERHRGPAGRKALEDEMHLVEPAYLLAMANRDLRRSYLDRVERHRGELARKDLERRIVELWELRKADAA